MDVSTLDKYILKECFAINLKWYRFNKNYTQEQLAELSNLTAKYISALELRRNFFARESRPKQSEATFAYGR